MAKRFSKGRLKLAFNWAKNDLTRLGIDAPLVNLECDGFENPNFRPEGIIYSLFHNEKTGETLFRADYATGYTAYWRVANFKDIRFAHRALINKMEENGIEIFEKSNYLRAIAF